MRDPRPFLRTSRPANVAMSRTSRHEDAALLNAIKVGLSSTGPGSGMEDDAAAVAAVLVDHGMVLPAGVTIGAVFEVFRNGTRDGYEFTDRREADEHARFGGHDGRCGEVRTAWRIKANGVDTITTWRAV